MSPALLPGPMIFKDRNDAGRKLAEKLLNYKNKRSVIVLGIPRGGVVVAAEIAHRLQLPLDVVVIKKIGAPGNEELAIGATGTDYSNFRDDPIREYHLSSKYLQEQIREKQQQARARYTFLRGNRKKLSVRGKIIILVDDGVAMGATMMTAIQILQKEKPKKIIVAIPVAPPRAVYRLREAVEEVICLREEEYFTAIGQFYADFNPVQEEEVRRILKKASTG